MKKQLSAAQIKYLFAIYKLEQKGEVRQRHIAQSLGVSNPSVHKMLLQLEEQDLRVKNRYSSLTITPNGKKTVAEYYGSYCKIQRLLAENIHLPEQYLDQVTFAVLGELGVCRFDFTN